MEKFFFYILHNDPLCALRKYSSLINNGNSAYFILFCALNMLLWIKRKPSYIMMQHHKVSPLDICYYHHILSPIPYRSPNINMFFTRLRRIFWCDILG